MISKQDGKKINDKIKSMIKRIKHTELKHALVFGEFQYFLNSLVSEEKKKPVTTGFFICSQCGVESLTRHCPICGGQA